jgi:hypothetical protein
MRALRQTGILEQRGRAQHVTAACWRQRKHDDTQTCAGLHAWSYIYVATGANVSDKGFDIAFWP